MNKLTKKQKAFADKLIANPKMSATQAALQVYGKPNKPTTYHTAGDIASSNLKKPELLKYLNKHIETAEIVILDVMQNSSKLKDEPQHANIALAASKQVLDRTLGLPVARHENLTTSVNLNLDLSNITSVRRT